MTYSGEGIQRLTRELEEVSRDPYRAYGEGKAILEFAKQQDTTAFLPDSLPAPSHLAVAVNEREEVLARAQAQLQSSLLSAYAIGVDSVRSIEEGGLANPSLAENLRKIGDDLERYLSIENLDPRNVAFAQGIHDGLKERLPAVVPEEVPQQMDRIGTALARAQEALPTFERQALAAGVERGREVLGQVSDRTRALEVE